MLQLQFDKDEEEEDADTDVDAEDGEGRTDKEVAQYQWSLHDWALLIHIMLSPEVASLYGRSEQHLGRADFEAADRGLPKDELLKTLVLKWNDESVQHNSRSVTQRCSDLRGMDANKVPAY